MPAYRSEAEAEIRTAVVERLRQIIPDCRIIHEINATNFGNRIDVMAVGRDRIAAVEIKSKKDKLDRLPDQVAAMRHITPLVFAAMHEKFLTVNRCGDHLPPNEARGAVPWIYPRVHRQGHVECCNTWFDRDRYAKPMRCLEPGAINVLWRAELLEICGRNRIGASTRLTMPELIDLISWHMTGEQVTKAICAMLRERNCCEADPAIIDEAAA